MASLNELLFYCVLEIGRIYSNRYVRQGHYAVHQVGLDDALADLALAGRVAGHGAFGHHEARPYYTTPSITDPKIPFSQEEETPRKTVPTMP